MEKSKTIPNNGKSMCKVMSIVTSTCYREFLSKLKIFKSKFCVKVVENFDNHKNNIKTPNHCLISLQCHANVVVFYG
jgi:hypothetical protein